MRKTGRELQAKIGERGMKWMTHLPLRHLLKAEFRLRVGGDEAKERNGGEERSEVHSCNVEN